MEFECTDDPSERYRALGNGQGRIYLIQKITNPLTSHPHITERMLDAQRTMLGSSGSIVACLVEEPQQTQSYAGKTQKMDPIIINS